MDWQEYIGDYYLALRAHLLKNEVETIALSRRRLSSKVRLYNLGRATAAVVAALAACAAAWQFGLSL